jgi:hypothetical protein
MDESVEARWREELEKPTAFFFEAFSERSREENGLRDAVREAVKTLIPLVDWDAYLPHLPHGLLGLRAVYRLKPYLSDMSFHRALATQLHAFAQEGRKFRSVLPSKGSGSWKNVELAIEKNRPSLAQGEMLGIEEPTREDFQRLGVLVAKDMANVGHKAVTTHHLKDLFTDLGAPKATGRRMLSVAAWLAATPSDAFWNQRAAKRLDLDLRVPFEREIDDASLQESVRELCDLGLVELLDRWSERLKRGMSGHACLGALVLAASEKQLDARRDLEGKTSWNFVYLATQALEQAPLGDPRHWCQAAALINLFPTDEEEGRVKGIVKGEVSATALLDALLDSEPSLALGLADAVFESEGGDSVLRSLAEAASQNDPVFNHSHQLMMIAAAADLLPLLPIAAQRTMLSAMAKSLANSQGSSDLARLAERALKKN